MTGEETAETTSTSRGWGEETKHVITEDVSKTRICGSSGRREKKFGIPKYVSETSICGSCGRREKKVGIPKDGSETSICGSCGCREEEKVMRNAKIRFSTITLCVALFFSGCSSAASKVEDVAVSSKQNATSTLSEDRNADEGTELLESGEQSVADDTVTTLSQGSIGKIDNTNDPSYNGITSMLSRIDFHAGRRVGSFQLDEVLPEINGLDEEGVADMERAVRAFGGRTKSNIMVNEAKEFYYYKQLDRETQKIYDAILTLCEEPDDEESVVVLKTKLDVDGEEFNKAYALAYVSVLYDHPELFWLYNGIKTNISVYSQGKNKANTLGYTNVYLMLDDVYENFEKDMKAFNKAVNKFFSDIDKKATDREKALAIHDKLVELVTYDYEMLEGKNSFANLGHTAYGALVADSEGRKNHAVCDGYSLAYCYLCQQVGLSAVVIVGQAGEDYFDAENHAWAMVCIDGSWQEVDATWDDTEQYVQFENEIEQALKEEELDDLDSEAATYLLEALQDENYMDILEHYLCLVSTQRIATYEPGEQEYFTSSDGKVNFSLINSSIHLRSSELNDDYYSALMMLAPMAE